MNLNDLSFEKVIDSEAALLTEEDSFYEYYASPLKPSSVVKKQHLDQIKEFLNFKEIREQCKKAGELVNQLLPARLSLKDFSRVQEEMSGASAHFMKFMESMEGESAERPILLQEMLGFSDETLLSIYDEACRLMGEKEYADANTLLVLLTMLAPHVMSYWIAEGLCLQELNRHEEALAVFNGALMLDELNPAPVAYSIDSYIALSEGSKAKELLAQFSRLMESYTGSDVEALKRRMEALNLQLIS